MNPPFTVESSEPGLADVVATTLSRIDYPWDPLKPYLDQNHISSIPIKTPMPDGYSNTITGLWQPADRAIYLGTQFSGWMDSVPFVLTHEIGHLVDLATLGIHQHDALMALMHDHPDWGIDPDVTHDSQYMHHMEFWSNGGDPYPAKIYECFADEFVASFAPETWKGHFPRFVHWTDDFAKVRELTLWEKPVVDPTPPPAPTPPKDDPVKWTRGKRVDDAINDLSVWLKDHPKKSVNRTKVWLARKTLRSIKPHKA